ncbi:MAG: carboxypeptidase-like regulatory domain-containing protein [Gammaproteobacteria bacterium]|nr:carboxypeptidase-like regulatory domain-containing protein [Gammaproteobacteria bacterium]
MNAWWSAVARVVALGACASVSGADWVEQRTAHDRIGTYNGKVVVRVLDPWDEPVATTVGVTGAGEAETDPNGRAELQGIFTRRGLSVDVGGTDDLRPNHQRVRGASNGIVDLGLVRLEPNFVVTGVLLQKDVDGVLKPRSDYVTVELRGPLRRQGGGYGYVHAHDQDRREEIFRIEDFDIAPDLYIEISWWSDEQRDSIVHKVPFAVDPARPHRHLLVTLPREDAEDQSVDVQERVWPAGVPAEPPLMRFAGRLVTSGGRPLAGLPVRGAPMTVYTAEDGRFELEAPYMLHDLTVPTRSGQLYISSSPWFGGADLDTLPSHYNVDADTLPPRSVVDFDQPFEANFKTLRPLRLVVTGEREERIDYHWLDWDEWRPTSMDLLRRVLGKSDERTLVRARVPGRIDRFARYPPKNSRVVFDFRNDEPHGLVVVDKGEPVLGAKVDILDVAAPLTLRLPREDPHAPILLTRAATDSKGRLSLLGDPDGLYVAYVYVAGYEPARIRLSAGVDERVDLVARDVDVRFKGLVAGELLRVKVAKSDAPVAVLRGVDNEPVAARLAPGSYDATVEDESGEIVAGTTFALAGATLIVDLLKDDRPKVVLHLAEGRESRGWFAGGTRRTLPHRSLGIPRFFSEWREFVDGEGPAQVESDGATRVLRFPGTGRWTVHVGQSRTQSFFIEVDLVAGEVRELRLPPLDASLEGTMTYEPDLDDEAVDYHWVDGPRMMLLSMDASGDGWNVMYSLPRPDGNAGRKPCTFALTGLPAGDYHLSHHLADRQAWGGRRVNLVAGATTRVTGLGSDQPGRLVVEVVDAGGQPVRNRILRVRDRMYKEWTAPGRIIITGGRVEPIPIPPTVRLDGAPVVLAPIRPGWLELVVDDPAGDARHYLRKVEPGKTLRLVVDS